MSDLKIGDYIIFRLSSSVNNFIVGDKGRIEKITNSSYYIRNLRDKSKRGLIDKQFIHRYVRKQHEQLELFLTGETYE